MKTSIKEINGNWTGGLVLDKHTVRSTPIGYNEYGHMQFDTLRTEVGESLHQLKNRNDWEQVDSLANELFISAFPKFENVGLIVPVPASKVRLRQPVFELARALACKAELTSFENIILKSPAKDGDPQLKDLGSKEEKTAALDGRLTINDGIGKNGKWNVLVIDDLFHTGATMEAVCTALATYDKIERIYVAALTWRR